MAVLKKIRASTLMETLVATVLIVIIFMVSSMLLNSMFSNSIEQNTHLVRERLNELQYQYQNNGIKIPYNEELEIWDINVSADNRSGVDMVIFEATNNMNKKSLTKSLMDEK